MEKTECGGQMRQQESRAAIFPNHSTRSSFVGYEQSSPPRLAVVFGELPRRATGGYTILFDRFDGSKMKRMLYGKLGRKVGMGWDGNGNGNGNGNEPKSNAAYIEGY